MVISLERNHDSEACYKYAWYLIVSIKNQKSGTVYKTLLEHCCTDMDTVELTTCSRDGDQTVLSETYLRQIRRG